MQNTATNSNKVEMTENRMDEIEAGVREILEKYFTACDKLEAEIRASYPEVTQEEIDEAIGFFAEKEILV